jgi:hypothetical protein
MLREDDFEGVVCTALVSLRNLSSNDREIEIWNPSSQKQPVPAVAAPPINPWGTGKRDPKGVFVMIQELFAKTKDSFAVWLSCQKNADRQA